VHVTYQTVPQSRLSNVVLACCLLSCSKEDNVFRVAGIQML